MKAKNFLLSFFSAVFLLQVSSVPAQVIPNSGFENWTVDIWDNFNPDNWETCNGDWQSMYVTRTFGYQGNYALRTGNNWGSGQILTYAKCRFPVISHPLSLNAYVKTQYLITDSVSIEIFIYHNGITVDSGKWINTNLSPIAIWAPVSIPISQFTTNADSVEIQFNGRVEAGTSLYVDDLTLTYLTSANEIQTVNIPGSYISSDETGNNFLSLNLSSPSSFTLNIFSVDGEKVFEKKYSLGSGAHQIPVYTNELDAGIYFCRLQGDGVNKVFKFVK